LILKERLANVDRELCDRRIRRAKFDKA